MVDLDEIFDFMMLEWEVVIVVVLVWWGRLKLDKLKVFMIIRFDYDLFEVLCVIGKGW